MTEGKEHTVCCSRNEKNWLASFKTDTYLELRGRRRRFQKGTSCNTYSIKILGNKEVKGKISV
jgi:hypothetical protein